MKNNHIRIVLIISCLLSLIIFFININNGSIMAKNINNLKIQNNDIYSYIAHAGGGYKEKTYSNSKEAL